MAIREERTLSAPTIFLDGRRLKIIPNSCMHELPFEAKVRAVSAGGGAVEMVYGVDLEAGACKVEFELPCTAEYVELAQDYASRRVGNSGSSTIRIVEETEQFHYDQMTLVNKIEIPHEPEGKIKFEFEGRYAAVV